MAFYTPQPNLENNQLPLLQPTQTPLPEPKPEFSLQKHVKRFTILITFSCMLVILSLMAFIFSLLSENTTRPPVTVVPQIVKTEGLSFNWTEDMLKWQKSGYHLQSQNKWMSDPDGPLYHKGYYHLFYQRNPVTVLWGTMLWAHVVSTDLIHWKELPFAIVPDKWYETNGAWGGSATILPNGNILMLYTGGTENPTAQVQNLAYPANLSDPLLLEWVKYPGNPVLNPPDIIDAMDFRDPTSAWVDRNGVWWIILGSKNGTTGISLLYNTKDFKSYEFKGNFHQVQGTGIWECLDFYPVSTKGDNGLDNSAYGPGMKHLFKASLEDVQEDYYSLGTYDMDSQTWTPDNPEMDVGIGLRLDYGKFYASKSFFDPHKKRRVLWGMVKETDTEADDILRGWVHMQAIPRVVTYDAKTGNSIIQWPVEELESLRKDHKQYDNLLLHPGSIIDLNITSAGQLDISAEFVINQEAIQSTVEDDVINNCNPAYVRQALGPFGIVVLADESLSELTPIYFYIAKASDGNVKKWFCTDQSRSTKASGVDKKVHGGPIPILEGENYNIRILVDHTIVEAFGQGGRTCVTSRLYPTRAFNENSRVLLFNNATKSSVTSSVNIWNMDSY